MANNNTRVIPATSWGKMCKMDNGTLSANGWTVDQTSEDCLNLNGGDLHRNQLINQLINAHST